mmetsp:Transcript_9264/g.23855  ORF Transcript_9264/g.23855 Transcript_9264/m.23855 type:complete len:256 (+) Transcript_9264:579-1346(+)
MNASEQEIVPGSAMRSGFTTASREAAFKMGKRVVAQPTAEKSCVPTEPSRRTRVVTDRALIDAVAAANPAPTTWSRPDSEKPLLMAKPPPMSSKTPKSNFSCTAVQESTVSPRLRSEGMKNRATAGMVATTASLANGTPYLVVMRCARHGVYKISPKICKKCRIPTRTGSRHPASPHTASYSDSKCSTRISMQLTCLTYLVQITPYARRNVTRDIGKANANHFIQVISYATRGNPSRMRFGMLPVSVAMPPAVLA